MERFTVRTRITIGLVAVALFGGVAGGSAFAHEGITSSNPPSRSTLQEPISTVEIDFGAPIGDDVAMFLSYDRGNDEFDELGGTTVKTGDTTARLDFDEIDREGTYFVRYLAPIPLDGDVVAGAISFTYGSPSTSGSGGFPVVPFSIAAIIVLAVGAWFSYRRMLQPIADDGPTVDDELVDGLEPDDVVTGR